MTKLKVQKYNIYDKSEMIHRAKIKCTKMSNGRVSKYFYYYNIVHKHDKSLLFQIFQCSNLNK